MCQAPTGGDARGNGGRPPDPCPHQGPTRYPHGPRRASPGRRPPRRTPSRAGQPPIASLRPTPSLRSRLPAVRPPCGRRLHGCRVSSCRSSGRCWHAGPTPGAVAPQDHDPGQRRGLARQARGSRHAHAHPHVARMRAACRHHLGRGRPTMGVRRLRHQLGPGPGGPGALPAQSPGLRPQPLPGGEAARRPRLRLRPSAPMAPQAGYPPPHRRKGIESAQRLGRHRWVVERTVSWLAGCRRLHRRYERKAEHVLAFAGIAAALMCHGRLVRADGPHQSV